MKPKIASLALLAALATSASGCFWVTTKAEGEKISKQVSSLQGTVDGQETKIDAKLMELQKVLEEATALLARNSADLGQEVKSLDTDLRTMRGLINEIKKYTDDLRDEIKALELGMNQRDKVYQMKFDDLDKRLMALETKAAGPQDPDELWTAGKKSFDDKSYGEARGYFKRLVINHSGHSRADDAQYYRAESYMREQSYEQAIVEFQKIFDKYSKSDLADDAFYRAGEAAEALRNCREARAYYGALRSRYKSSKLVSKAKERDAFLKKHASNSKYCRK